MSLRFTKMHGLGNDYIYVSLFDQTVDDAPALARRISDRHRGVGADGLILVAPPTEADAHVRMIIYNADGSRAQMCGNGIRCVAKLAYERGLTRADPGQSEPRPGGSDPSEPRPGGSVPLNVQTDAGVLALDLTLDAAQRVSAVRVDMGVPILDPRRIPVALPGDRLVSRPIALGAMEFALTCVSMGNPHAVCFVPDVTAVPLAVWGPPLERHPLFPERINVHFVQVLRSDFVRMVTWERGSGATLACGTGASAVCVAGVLNGFTQRSITAELPGGQLELEWRADSDHVFMTGPAEEVFTGDWLLRVGSTAQE